MGGGGSNQQSSLDDPEVVEQGAFTEINIVPLVDIMLVLLVILMATSTAILEAGQGEGAGFKVNLPTGSATEEVNAITNQLVVAILDTGEIIVDGEVVSMDELRGLFQKEAKANANKVVLVQADERAYHKQVVSVMNAAQEAGLNNLAIATKPKE